MRILWFVLVALALVIAGCEPKFAQVTFAGAPVCPDSKLQRDVVVKVDGPRVSVMQRLNGREGGFTAKLQQGKEYELKAYACATEPCETSANLADTQKVTAPESETGSVTLELKGLPPCEPVAPPPSATADAGS
jgi:hypothetical protein